MHILNYQRELVVGWIIHIELKVLRLSRVYEFDGYKTVVF